MAVKQLRRLGVSTGSGLLDQVRGRTFHWAPRWRAEVEAIESEHPRLVVRDGDNILSAVGGPVTRLIYGYESDRAFAARFPEMFETLLPRLRKQLNTEIVRFRLDYAPARPMVEPVLRRLSFEPQRDWLEFELARAKVTLAAAPRGIRFRDATADDLDALVRLDAEAFPNSAMDPRMMTAALDRETVIVAVRGADVAGVCMFDTPEPGEGWISNVAVGDAHRGLGLGAALLTRACKRLFADGAHRVALTTDDDNSTAIRLYVRLGFRQSGAGRDYSRLADPKAIERARRADGIVIRFGGWR